MQQKCRRLDMKSIDIRQPTARDVRRTRLYGPVAGPRCRLEGLGYCLHNCCEHDVTSCAHNLTYCNERARPKSHVKGGKLLIFSRGDDCAPHPLKFCVMILSRFGGESGSGLNMISFKYQTSSTEVCISSATFVLLVLSVMAVAEVTAEAVEYSPSPQTRLGSGTVP